MKLLKYGTANVYYADLKPDDKCPVCKNQFRTIRYYGGKLTGRQTTTSRGLAYDQTNTTLTYGDFQQLIGGYCSTCAEKAFYDQGEKKKEVKKNLKLLITCLAIVAVSLLIYIVVGDSIAALSVILSIAMFGAGIITMPATILLIISLVALKSKKKYVEPTASELESAIVNACNSDKNRHAVTQMTGMSKFFTASQIRQ